MGRYPKTRKCPFCGKKPKIHKIKHKSLVDGQVFCSTYLIGCDDCGISFLESNGYKKIIDKWNGKLKNENI